MKRTAKRWLSMFLTLVMVLSMIPTTALAAVGSYDSETGRPDGISGDLTIAIYKNSGVFPGEPAVHGTSDYTSISTAARLLMLLTC